MHSFTPAESKIASSYYNSTKYAKRVIKADQKQKNNQKKTGSNYEGQEMRGVPLCKGCLRRK